MLTMVRVDSLERPAAPASGGWRVRVRRLACCCVERWGRALVALGVAGLLGFVGSHLAFSQRYLGLPSLVLGTLASLAVYSAALLLGHLGDPAGLERQLRFERARRPLRSPRAAWAGSSPPAPGSPPPAGRRRRVGSGRLDRGAQPLRA